MKDDSQIKSTFEDANQEPDRPTRGRRIGRRAVMKAGAASVAGLALGTTYLKPGMISVGVQEVYVASYVVFSEQTTSQTETSSDSEEGFSAESTSGSENTDTSTTTTTTTDTSSSGSRGGGPKDSSGPSQGKKAPVDTR